MVSTPEVDEAIDGRTARAVRTKDAIVDACLGLIDDGDLRPTGPRIAERAGVSVRSIFQHFDDLDALFSAVGDRVTLRVMEAVSPIDPGAPLSDRVDSFIDQRGRVLEIVTPVLRAALVHAASSKVIRKQFESGHDFFRTQAADVFAPEIEEASDPFLLRHALIVCFSWTTWETLRAAQGCSAQEASAVVAWTVRAALRTAGFNP